MRLIDLAKAAAAALILSAAAAPAQSPFAPAILIDGRAITGYELQQRQLFLQVLGAPGDLAAEAEKTLIDDRLRLIAAERLGLSLNDAQIREGMAEFAARAELSAEEFVAIIAEAGVAPETFRDFVEAGLLWRNVVRARFGEQMAAAIAPAQAQRALSLPAQRGVARLLLSEIQLHRGQEKLARELAATLKGEAAFAAAARAHSVAGNAAEGGRLDWVPATALPPALVDALASQGNGAVAGPVPTEDGLSLFLLRGIDQQERVGAGITAVDYALLLIPGAGTPEALAEADRIRARIAGCDDFYPVARGLPADRLIRETRTLPQLPRDIAAELERLDEGELTVTAARPGYTGLLMLCTRRVASGRAPMIDGARERIFAERLSARADIYLEQLRANAHIRRP
jgi:peptidyl-prolyl cis-trans isomerase SurA